MRVFWLVATGIAAIWKAPGIADDVGYGLAYASTASVLPASIVTFVGVASAWLFVGVVGGLLMERQPWYRSLYLLVPMFLYLLAAPGIR